MTAREELFQLHTELCHLGRTIMAAKNHDYSGGDDPYANFRFSESIGIPGELGILMRVLDKIKRLETYIRTGHLLVPGEGAMDAVVDVINYMVLLAGLMKDREGEDTQVVDLPARTFLLDGD